MRILLTGATGFIGSHLAESLIENGHQLLLTKRIHSDLSKCINYRDKVIWVNTDKNDWCNTAINFRPNLLIHAAWNGVENNTREDWTTQLTNIDFMYHLLKIANFAETKKIICLGSQAEYGNFEGPVDEEYTEDPVSKYGIVKLTNLQLLKSFSTDHSIDWYWLRIFGVLGENDNTGWLLPSVIRRLKNNKNIQLTAGEQQYDYIYIKDLCRKLQLIVENKANNPGVYNVCTGEGVRIKDLLLLVANKLSKSDHLLEFGVLPYRPNQTMNMVGSSDKFNRTFGEVPCLSVSNIIDKLI